MTRKESEYGLTYNFGNNLSSQLLKGFIRGYQRFISPLTPAKCRYYPTCSEYGMQAIAWHGASKGGWLTVMRVCSCHPLGGHGVDFVPLPLYRFQFEFVKSACHSDNPQSQNKYIYRSHLSNNQQAYYADMLNYWMQYKR